MAPSAHAHGACHGRDNPSTNQLRVATHLAPSVGPLYGFLASYLAERLGRRAEFVVAESYERCAQDVDDICFVCSVPYLLFAATGRIRMEAIAAPVLIGERYRERPIYFSDVVVRRDSPYRSFDDLRGRTWAYNEPFSHSGYIVLLHEVLRRGAGPDFLGELVEAGFHQESMRLVLDGAVDAAAIDSQVLGIAMWERPELGDQLRVVDAIGPSTIQPVVASADRLTADEREAILRALTEVGGDLRGRSLMDAALVDRFVPVTDASYDDVRTMLRRVQGSGMLHGDWNARWAAVSGTG